MSILWLINHLITKEETMKKLLLEVASLSLIALSVPAIADDELENVGNDLEQLGESAEQGMDQTWGAITQFFEGDDEEHSNEDETSPPAADEEEASNNESDTNPYGNEYNTVDTEQNTNTDQEVSSEQ